MIVKLDIVKAAKVLAKNAIESYYVNLNKDKSPEEIEKLIYITNDKEIYFDKNGIEVPFDENRKDLEKRIIRERIDFKPVVKEEVKLLYEQYFKTLKDVKNYN